MRIKSGIIVGNKDCRRSIRYDYSVRMNYIDYRGGVEVEKLTKKRKKS